MQRSLEREDVSVIQENDHPVQEPTKFINEEYLSLGSSLLMELLYSDTFARLLKLGYLQIPLGSKAFFSSKARMRTTREVTKTNHVPVSASCMLCFISSARYASV